MSDSPSPSTDDVVAVLYPQTGALRLFPSTAVAKQHVNTTTLLKCGARSALDLQRSYDHAGLERVWRKIFEHAVWGWPRSSTGPAPTDAERSPPDCETETLARELWSLILRVGDRVVRAAPGSSNPKDHYEIKLDLIRAVLETEDHDYNRQCSTILQGLVDMGEPFVNAAQLQKMMLRLVSSGGLRTKQDPWLIWLYYRGPLIKDGLVVRGVETGADTATDEAA